MRNNRDCTLSPLGNVLLPISKTLSREGVLRDPGLFGVPGFEVLAESRLENMSASRLRECLNCDSESRLHAQENSEMSLGWDADMYIYIIIFRVNIRISRKEERGEEKNIEAHSVRRKKSTSAQNKSGRRKVSTGEKRVFGKEAKGARSRCGSIARYFRGSFILTNGAFGWRMVKPRGEIRPAQTCTRV